MARFHQSWHCGGIDISEQLNTIDLWVLRLDHVTSNIMTNAKRIKELTVNISCPYELLKQPLAEQIVDFVGTDESLCVGRSTQTQIQFC